jgi:hypothetical protein
MALKWVLIPNAPKEPGQLYPCPAETVVSSVTEFRDFRGATARMRGAMRKLFSNEIGVSQ